MRILTWRHNGPTLASVAGIRKPMRQSIAVMNDFRPHASDHLFDFHFGMVLIYSMNSVFGRPGNPVTPRLSFEPEEFLL